MAPRKKSPVKKQVAFIDRATLAEAIVPREPDPFEAPRIASHGFRPRQKHPSGEFLIGVLDEARIAADADDYDACIHVAKLLIKSIPPEA